MTLNPESKYPTRRAYVVKLRGDAKPGELAGRLENLVTGQSREFASGRELLDSVHPLTAVPEQLERLASGQVHGKVLFDPSLPSTAPTAR